MQITALWFYPIKSLRGIPLTTATLTPQGIQHDRTFMLCTPDPKTGALKKVQMSSYPQCGLFSQTMSEDGGTIRVRYHRPAEPIVPHDEKQDEMLEVPLRPEMDGLEQVETNLHQSKVNSYRMGAKYDAWFTACFGFDIIFLYIGDQKRPVLGTFSPKTSLPQPPKGWLSSISSYITSAPEPEEEDWLTFTDCAPFLIASDTSLSAFSKYLTTIPAEMYKFRPNIVVSGTDPWDEDFWSTLSLNKHPTFALTMMCNRCTSLNVDYDTGKTGTGEKGDVLKRLMKDRRVDAGMKYSPVFGRYAFLKDGAEGEVKIGDEVDVEGRAEERPKWDWPMKDANKARFYGQKG